MNPVAILTNETVFATTLYCTLLKLYGTEIYDWEPDTIWLELQDDFGIGVGPRNKDKIQAGLALTGSNRFYDQFEGFVSICKALNNESPSFATLTVLTPEEMAWGVTEAVLLDDPTEAYSEENPFDEEVRTYVKKTLQHQGLYLIPEELKVFRPKDYMPDPEMLNNKNQQIRLLRIKTYVRMQSLKLQEELDLLKPR